MSDQEHDQGPGEPRDDAQPPAEEKPPWLVDPKAPSWEEAAEDPLASDLVEEFGAAIESARTYAEVRQSVAMDNDGDHVVTLTINDGLRDRVMVRMFDADGGFAATKPGLFWVFKGEVNRKQIDRFVLALTLLMARSSRGPRRFRLFGFRRLTFE